MIKSRTTRDTNIAFTQNFNSAVKRMFEAAYGREFRDMTELAQFSCTQIKLLPMNWPDLDK